MKEILRCTVCGAYTLREECHGPTLSPRPAKYSPHFKHKELRRRARKELA